MWTAKMPERFRDAWLNTFARECFVDTGDRDYLCARSAWRHRLVEHFLWNGLQVVEKYLKAILLFNGRSAKGLSHNLERAFGRVLAISDIPFDFPKRVVVFIAYLHRHGPSRYLEIPFYARGHELVELAEGGEQPIGTFLFLESGGRDAAEFEVFFVDPLLVAG